MNEVNEYEKKVCQVLHLSSHNFYDLPESILELGQFTEDIYLRWNMLTTLPQWIRILNLKEIYLSNNKFSQFPEEVTDLRHLEVLHLDENSIEIIPPSIGKLENLTDLNLSRNYLTSLPKDVGKLVKLKFLALSQNKLQMLPQDIFKIDTLQNINLEGNQLLYLSRAVVYLPNLVHINVRNNNLHIFPYLPFSSLPNIIINGNMHLNCMSHLSVYQNFQKNENFEENYGRCETWEAILKDETYIQVETLCSKNVLHFPHGLKTFNNFLNLQTPPTLFEICLRNIYKYFYFHKIQEIKTCSTKLYNMRRIEKFNVNKCSILPASIITLIEEGPVVLCFNIFCQIPLFSHSVGWIEHSSKVMNINHCVFMFCSLNCAKTYFKNYSS